MGWFSDLLKPAPGERVEDYPVVLWKETEASAEWWDRYGTALREAGIECKRFGFEMRARAGTDLKEVKKARKKIAKKWRRETREQLSAYNETRVVDDWL